METVFYQLNEGWNAEPNVPKPAVEIQGDDVILRFVVNPYQFSEFEDGEIGILRFVQCNRYRLGSTNDHGWYLGQCRFSNLAPKWGEFYLVQGDPALLEAPRDWCSVAPQINPGRHFLFYFREETFECSAEQCIIERSGSNSLHQRGKQIPCLPD
jgi:hypothetical protein